MESLRELIPAVRQYGASRLVVAQAADEVVLEAVEAARREGLVEAVLVGDPQEIRRSAARIELDLAPYTVHEVPAGAAAHQEAVRLVAAGGGDVLMKGMVSTADLLREVLGKESRLTTGRLLSHLALAETPHYERLLLLTDCGLNIAPDLAQKVHIVQNAIDVACCIGIQDPVAAVLAAVETVNPAMPATLEAACLAKMSERGGFRGGRVEGPLALDNAVSVEAARRKGIPGELAGRADILVVPDIQAGNILYKALAFLGGAEVAGVIVGARVPVVVPSRSDTAAGKLYSIALAALTLRRGACCR